jgi:hypothetical protein
VLTPSFEWYSTEFHFGFKLVRRALDLPPSPYQGKGAAICSGRCTQLAVGSMARRP